MAIRMTNSPRMCTPSVRLFAVCAAHYGIASDRRGVIIAVGACRAPGLPLASRSRHDSKYTKTAGRSPGGDSLVASNG
jgi:hypothetical protein